MSGLIVISDPQTIILVIRHCLVCRFHFVWLRLCVGVVECGRQPHAVELPVQTHHSYLGSTWQLIAVSAQVCIHLVLVPYLVVKGVG